MGWTKRQCQLFAKQAKERVGRDGWEYLSKPQREALVAKQIVDVLFSQFEESYKPIQDMIRDTMNEAGLGPEDE